MRIGCLGLNANPPHIGHLAAAAAFRWSGFVDAVWFIPSYEHPFSKSDVAPWEHRVNMCRLLENPAIQISASLVEAEMGETEEYKFQKTFTVYALEHLRKTRPAHEFYWCVGSDIITSGSYKNWYCWDKLEQEDKILVAEREGYPLLKGALPRPFVRVSNTYKEVSSTRIRALIHEGIDIGKYTGREVAEYIRKHKLYQT